jgi:hypothetical protein
MRASVYSLLGGRLAGLLALGLLGFFAGCRTPPLDHPISDDFGTINNTSGDMAMKQTNKHDLSVPNGMGCNSLVMCLDNCIDQQCQNDCYNNASSDAQNAFGTAINCVYSFCLQPDGKRAARCIELSDGSFDDPPDAGMAGECDLCLQNAYAGLGGYPCQPTNSPDCNPSTCNTLVQACLSN